MGFIAENICQDLLDATGPTDDLIDWRRRYEGVLVVAYLDGKAVAGISGPWPVNQYALTWWDRPVPARQLELFDSMEAAQKRVEEWAWRMRTIGVIDRAPANDDPIQPQALLSAPARPSWLVKLREILAGSDISRQQRAPRRDMDMMMRCPPLRDDDLRDIHFAAIE